MSFGTTVSSTSFLLQSDGFIAGTLYGKFPDRYRIEGGTLVSTATSPIYGGLPLTTTVVAPSSSGGSSGLGEVVAAAVTSGANINAWSVFDQASAGVISATSNVPLYYANASVNFVRSGSGVYLALPVNPSAVATIAGGSATQTLYWDFVNNWVTTSGTGALAGVQVIALNTNSKTVTYAAGPPITANWAAGGSVIVLSV